MLAGAYDIVIAAGVESMSRVPMGSDGGAWASDPATALTTGFVPQGIGADLIATIEGFSREDVDAFAAESQERAENAWNGGYFAKSVVPVRDINGVIVLDHDEHRRPGSTVESLGKLKPAFAALAEMVGLAEDLDWAVFEAARQAGWELGFGPLYPQDLFESDGVWLASSVRLIAPVTHLNGTALAHDPELTATLLNYLAQQS